MVSTVGLPRGWLQQAKASHTMNTMNDNAPSAPTFAPAALSAVAPEGAFASPTQQPAEEAILVTSQAPLATAAPTVVPSSSSPTFSPTTGEKRRTRRRKKTPEPQYLSVPKFGQSTPVFFCYSIFPSYLVRNDVASTTFHPYLVITSSGTYTCRFGVPYHDRR